MTRTNQLIARPKRTLGTLALALCAIGVAVGSGADYTSRTANPSNTFSAGSMQMENTKDGTAIFAPSNLKPGGPGMTGTVDIKNTGTLDGVFSLFRDQLQNTDDAPPNPTPLATKLIVKIVDCGKFVTSSGTTTTPTCGDGDDRLLYNGTLADENTGHALGIFKAGEQRRYQFTGSLDISATNEYGGDTASARYVFDAVQTPSA